MCVAVLGAQVMRATNSRLILISCAAAVLTAPAAGRADPPPGAAWKMVFNDEFERPELDLEQWTVVTDLPGHVASARHPDNVAIRDGVCRLLNKKETYHGREWTGAHVRSKSFAQKTGYFEARIRIAAAGGLNNGFWMTPDGKPGDSGHFEIDVAAIYHPKNLETYLCSRCQPWWTKGERWEAEEDLSEDYHVYALLWTNEELTWYFDGREIRRLPQTICRKEVRLHFSTAVTRYGGPATDAIDGTSMDVDYVRVFEKVERLPRWPAVHDGVQ